MKRIKIAFYSCHSYDKSSFEQYSKSDFNDRFDFTILTEYMGIDSVHLASGHDAVCISGNDVAGSDVIDELMKLGVKAIVLRCAGFDRVAYQYAKDRGLPVMRVPAYSPESVAEHAIALLMTVNRHLHVAYSRVSDNNFSIDNLQGVQLYGKTAGVVGTGKIGLCAARILKGLGMNVVAYDIYRNSDAANQIGFKYVDTLEELCRQSDVITLHIFASKENTHIINRELISKMKDGVLFVNTARGILVETTALIDAVKAGKVRGAGLDVYEFEAGLFFEDHSSDGKLDDHVLARIQAEPRILLSAHQAYFTDESLEAIAKITMNNLIGFFDNGIVNNRVE